MKERIREFNAIVGAAGHGKSTFTARIVRATPGRAIIFKSHINIDDPAFKEFPLVAANRYRGGKVKFSDMDISYKQFFPWIKKYYRDGAVVIDDATIYERNQISDELRELLAMRRHFGIDIYLVYHGLTGFPIDQFLFLNNLVLFNTNDGFKYKAGKIPNIEAFTAAQARISAQARGGNKYYKEVIHFSN